MKKVFRKNESKSKNNYNPKNEVKTKAPKLTVLSRIYDFNRTVGSRADVVDGLDHDIIWCVVHLRAHQLMKGKHAIAVHVVAVHLLCALMDENKSLSWLE